MPWKVEPVSDVRFAFLYQVEEVHRPMAQVCREFGISRTAGSKWIERSHSEVPQPSLPTEAYPQHQFLHTIGQLDCCRSGGCWKSRCQPVGDGDSKDRRNRCERPVAVREDLSIPQCLELIRPEDVISAIERTLAVRSARGVT